MKWLGLVALAMVLAVGCDEVEEATGRVEVGRWMDAGAADAATPDGASPDAEPVLDLGDADASLDLALPDTGAVPDGGLDDAGLGDAEVAETGLGDAEMADQSVADAALLDAALLDAAQPDAAQPDAALPDAALPDAEPVCAACSPIEACVDGACVGMPAPAVRINEVFYDADGGDRPAVFVELWGAAGQALDGLRLVGINGNGGALYAEVPLAGVISETGYFVIAHDDAGPDLAAVADLFSADADFQNGPDSIQLLWGEQVVDALGYGRFGNAVFAGEGAAAPDVPAGVSLTRDAAHTDSDDNALDFEAAEPSPGGSPMLEVDAGLEPDAGLLVDAGVDLDAAPEPDAEIDAEIDALIVDLGPEDAAPLPDADPFDERALLIVRPPAGHELPDHVPDNLGATSYGGAFGLQYNNDRYYVFETSGDWATELAAEAALGDFLRLPPGVYAVVLNDTFTVVDLDWNDRVEISAGRLEVHTPQPGTYTVQPSRRFDDIARSLALRGCGPFGNQARTRTLFGGCDGELQGGVFTLPTGINVLPGAYRVVISAQFHSPNQVFVGVEPGMTTAYEPTDVRATISVDPPEVGALPAWEPAPNRGSYGPPRVPMRYGNDRFYVLRYINIVEGFEYLGTSTFDRPLTVPAGRYHIVVNDTYVVDEVGVGEALVVPTAWVEVPGAGAYDLRPRENARRFNYVANLDRCARDGVETNIFASCSLPRTGVIARGTGLTVMPGTYELSVYDPAGALLSQNLMIAE